MLAYLEVEVFQPNVDMITMTDSDLPGKGQPESVLHRFHFPSTLKQTPHAKRF